MDFIGLVTLNVKIEAKLTSLPVWSWNWMYDLEKQWSTTSMPLQSLGIISKPYVNLNWSYHPETLKLGSNWRFFGTCDLPFDRWPWKTIEHLFYATSSSVHHFAAICEFKQELWSENAKIGAKFGLTSVTLTFCMDITFVNGNYSWKCNDDAMRGRLWKRYDRWTGPFIKLLGRIQMGTYVEHFHTKFHGFNINYAHLRSPW